MNLPVPSDSVNFVNLRLVLSLAAAYRNGNVINRISERQRMSTTQISCSWSTHFI